MVVRIILVIREDGEVDGVFKVVEGFFVGFGVD